jgi:drug/metabolite transporter (DMT)-like permease
VLVTVLWSSSWVLVRMGMDEALPPLTFAGLRYTLGFACLAPAILLHGKLRHRVRTLTVNEWVTLGVLGILLYTLTQGAIFVSLALLDATLVSLLLNLTPIVVAGLAALFLREAPTRRQWLGVLVCAAGVLLYFAPVMVLVIALTGLSVVAVGVLANAAAAVLGRGVNRRGDLPPILVTGISMGVGALALLGLGLATQGMGQLTPAQWGIVLWLAVINTALAFSLWNVTLRTLTATESSILNGLMVPQIAILAVIFLGETLTWGQWLGLGLVMVGSVLVQLGARQGGTREPEPTQEPSDPRGPGL